MQQSVRNVCAKFKGMLQPIFCVDINTHGDKKGKIMSNLFLKKLFLKNVLTFIDLFLQISLHPLFHLLRLHMTLYLCNM